MCREALVRLAQGFLGVEARVPRGGDDVEQELAEEIFIVDVERQVKARWLDLHARGSLEHPLGCEKRGELAWDPAEQGLRSVALFLPLDPFPLRQEIIPRDLLSGEHMRVPANQLFVQSARDQRSVVNSPTTSATPSLVTMVRGASSSTLGHRPAFAESVGPWIITR